MKSEHSPPICLSHTEHEKYIRTKNTIESSSFFGIDKISNDYINNHNKKIIYFLLNVIFIQFLRSIFRYLSKQIFIIILCLLN